MLACLAYWGAYDGSEHGLWEQLGTNPETGTEPDALERVAECYGVSALARSEMTLGDLRREFRRGSTIVVALQAWPDTDAVVTDWSHIWDDGHWVVLVGLDMENATFMDPSVAGTYAYLPIDEFLERWHDDDHGIRRDGMAVVIRGNAPADVQGRPHVRMR